MKKPMLKLEGVFFSFNSEEIFDGLNLEVRKGEILVIVGPSGCGKSTLLRLMAGLEKPNRGVLQTQDSVDAKGSYRFSFQDYDAFPWYTAWNNVKHSASSTRLPSDGEVDAILKKVGLLDSKDKYPMELSGGMRKRLALARCLVCKPAILFLDEPFTKLDVDTREDMYGLLQELWREFKPTIVLVTHDIHEAVLLGSRIVLSTPLPFRIASLIDVPFDYPRTDATIPTERYMRIVAELRNGLRRKC